MELGRHVRLARVELAREGGQHERIALAAHIPVGGAAQVAGAEGDLLLRGGDVLQQFAGEELVERPPLRVVRTDRHARPEREHTLPLLDARDEAAQLPLVHRVTFLVVQVHDSTSLRGEGRHFALVDASTASVPGTAYERPAL